MGEIVKMDSKGRITIPTSIRRAIGKDTFKVELMGKDAIIIRALENRRELVDRIRGMGLSGDRGRAYVDAARVKDLYGGVKR
ncbi:MAG: hypothetical protein QXU06_01630 [Candidatus Bathyarchaeia archaeon]